MKPTQTAETFFLGQAEAGAARLHIPLAVQGNEDLTKKHNRLCLKFEMWENIRKGDNQRCLPKASG